jgi:hypothetical protein
MGRVEAHENIAQFDCVFRDDSARVGIFVKALQSSVADRPNHSVL